MRRLIANKVFSGLVTAWRLADWPTKVLPSSVKATIDGVVRSPSEFSITLMSLPSITATQEFVVPKSIPITFDIIINLYMLYFKLITIYGLLVIIQGKAAIQVDPLLRLRTYWQLTPQLNFHTCIRNHGLHFFHTSFRVKKHLMSHQHSVITEQPQP